MRRTAERTVVTVLTLALLTACGSAGGPGPAEHAERIRALDAAWTEAAARRDLDAMMEIYAPDARELLPGMPAIVGRATIREFYAGLIETFPRFEHHFEADEILVAGSGDLAVVRGTYRFTPDARRPQVTQVGKFVGVWRRRDSAWRLLINVSNGDQPPG